MADVRPNNIALALARHYRGVLERSDTARAIAALHDDIDRQDALEALATLGIFKE